MAHGVFVAVASVAVVPVLAFSALSLLPWVWGLVAAVVLNVVGVFLYRNEAKLPGWLSRLLALAADKWPPISAWARVEDVRVANAALVNEFDLTLREYRLGRLSPKFSKDLSDRGRPLTIREIARRVKEARLTGTFSLEALELLHRERSGYPTLSLWQSRKEAVAAELAPILHRSERMPDPGPAYRFTPEDVHELLRGLHDFDVDFVAAELRLLGDLSQRLQRYARFFRDQGLTEEEPPLPPLAKAVRDHDGLELPAGPQTLDRLERTETALRLLDLVDGSMQDDALRAVHRGIFFAERDFGAELLKEQCTVVSRWDKTEADPVEILHAYLWKKDRRGAAGAPVTLAELDGRWSRWNARARKSLDSGEGGFHEFDEELNALRNRLDAGHWPIRRVDLRGKATFPPPVQLAVPKHDEVIPKREEGLRHDEVPPGHDEVRDLDAYLITFDERTGPVAELVDGLKTKRPRGRQTYRFGPYTRNTRLGLLPPKVPFHEFVEQFFADLDRVLREYPDPPYTKPAGALRVVEGRQRNIELRHDKPCEDEHGNKTEVDFDITKDPEEGWLGEIQRIDSQRVLVTYFPPSDLPEAMEVSFEYESRCGATKQERSVELFVEPRGRKQPLDQIEVTVNRIDLGHCRELWFGDEALGARVRPPSIDDVWDAIEGQLGPDETPLVRDLFDRIAGGR